MMRLIAILATWLCLCGAESDTLGCGGSDECTSDSDCGEGAVCEASSGMGGWPGPNECTWE